MHRSPKTRQIPLCYALPKVTGSKLSPKGKLGKLMGYNEELRSYCILLDNGRIIDSNHVQFLDYPTKPPCDDSDFHIIEEPFESNDLESDPDTVIPEDLSINNNDSSLSEDLFESALEDIVESSEEDVDIAATVVPETWTLRDRTSRVKPAKYSYLTV
ncbi:hypothetical protein Pst134EB_027443 [Puccinia striiformis f. sp. tritici]|nr:hypothetical protein Pst134EB_027443 [Puccinia striiformis f. sp. tritici]